MWKLELTLTVECVLIQVRGNASILVLLVRVVVVRDVHLPVLHLLLLPPEKRILGLQQFFEKSHLLVVSFEFCSLLPSSRPAKPPEPP